VRNTGYIQFTKHFHKRMVERGVSPQQVYNCVRKGDETIERRGIMSYSHGNVCVKIKQENNTAITCIVSKVFMVIGGVKKYVFKKF